MTIDHDMAHHRFILALEGGEAQLLYSLKDGVMDFYHVYVPPSHRGSGLAGRLCIAGFEYAREHQLRVRATCPFVAQDFVPRFPQYYDLLAD